MLSLIERTLQRHCCCAGCPCGSKTAVDTAVNLPELHQDESAFRLVKETEMGKSEDQISDEETSRMHKMMAAAQRFMDIAVAAMTSPAEDFGSDARELLTPVGTHLDRVSASIKLESMTRPAIVLVVALFYFGTFLALVMAIILIVLQRERNVSLAAAEASFALEGLSRTLGVVLTIFLLITFTFRVFRYTMQTKQPILPEQSLLILFLFLIMLTPGFSVYSPYVFWNQYANALELTTMTTNTSLFNNATITDGDRFAFFFFSTSNSLNTAKTMTSVFTVINLAFGAVFFGQTIFFFGKPQKHWKKKAKTDVETGGKSGSYKTLEGFLWEDDDEDSDDAHWLTTKEMVINCMSTYRRLAATANRPLILLAVAYLILVLALVLVYNFLPSQVPFIGMISVLKVCPLRSGTGEWAGKQNCDPSVLGGLPFARAMSITAQFVVEFIIAVYLHYLTGQTRSNLKKMPYEWNRAKHLGFRYFNSNKRVTFGIILLLSVIGCGAGDGLTDIYQVQFSSATNDFTVIYSPLKQVGINFFNPGFGPFYLLFACFLFALAWAYLPPDSAPGLRGFCCGGNAVVTECDLDVPAYILRESDVLLLRKCRDNAKRKVRRYRRMSHVTTPCQEMASRQLLIPMKQTDGQPAEHSLCEGTNVGHTNGDEGAEECGCGEEDTGHKGEEVPEDCGCADSDAGYKKEEETEECGCDEEVAGYKKEPEMAECGCEEEDAGYKKEEAVEECGCGEEEAGHKEEEVEKCRCGKEDADQNGEEATWNGQCGGDGVNVFEKCPIHRSHLVEVREPGPDQVVDIDAGTDTQSAATLSTSPANLLNTQPAKQDQDQSADLDDEETEARSGPLPVMDVCAQQYVTLTALLRPKLEVGTTKSLLRLMGSGSLGIISEQMNSNLFCLETEILLLNFAFMAYCFSPAKGQAPFTTEEKQAMLGKKSRYRLVSHIENAQTDIQCCVFVDSESEKIFVAFRGTATRKNVWEDIDTLQIRHPEAEKVEPLIRSTDDPFARRAATEKPCVHRGFFRAYQSIKQTVIRVVSEIIDSREGGCVLFSCGHSLGGALATHFGMDMGIKYPVLKSNLKGLQVSTFGSPRVGTFSYVCRHRRVVPTTHRFCIGGDPIPKLPPAQWFGDYTKWGFHHVGVEILLDIERFNLLVGPMYIERQIQDAWGGYIPKNHMTGSYVLVLALWSAQVHPSFSPDWWLPVVNHVLKTEMARLKRVMKLKKELSPAVIDQLSKEGAMWTDGKRALRNCGCDTSSAIDPFAVDDEESNGGMTRIPS